MLRPPRAVVPLLVLALVSLAPTARALAPPRCRPAWRVVWSPSRATDSVLEDVVAISSGDAWAVGSSARRGSPGARRTLVLHWEGTEWSLVRAPSPGASDELFAVAASSATDVWTVGSTWPAGDPAPRTLAMHWDGADWTVLPTPSVGTMANALAGVAAISPTDAWAVGRYATSGADYSAPLTVHWDGLVWSVVPSPDPGSGPFLWDVAAASAYEVWAVGDYYDPVEGRTRALTQRWNGSAWRLRNAVDPGYVYNSLRAVEAIGLGQIWAAGHRNDDLLRRILVERRDGSTWSQVPGSARMSAHGLAGVSAGDLWVVGGENESTRIAHLDGSRARRVSSPDPGVSSVVLGASALPSGRVWAVGSTTDAGGIDRTLVLSLCEITVGDGAFSPVRSIARLGDSVAWHFREANASAHTVADGSGLGLFGSGQVDPGGSFVFQFDAAGRYRIADPTTGAEGVVLLPVRRDPSGGSTGASFRITWAAEPASADLVYDVQIERPGGPFESWVTGVTTRRAHFVPDSGPGEYRFRARVRDAVSGNVTGWSPPRDISVS